MPFLDSFVELMLDLCKLLSLSECKGILHLLLQCPLILFECQGIVSVWFDDLCSNGGLRSHGIDRHKAAFQSQLLQERWNSRDLIGFLVHCDLCQDQPILRRPGDSPICKAFFPLPPSCERLKVLSPGGNDSGDLLSEAAYPLQKAVLKLFGIYPCKDPSECVMGRNPIGQVEDGAKPVSFHVPKLFNFYPSFRST
jgi:hypothetical protein